MMMLWIFLQEDVDALIDCVMKDVGFSQGKPVAAFSIYKCLLQWKSFEAERTSVFDRLIQMFGSAIEVYTRFVPALLFYLPIRKAPEHKQLER